MAPLHGAKMRKADARDVPLEERLRQKKNGFAVFPSADASDDEQQSEGDREDEFSNDASDNDDEQPRPAKAPGKASKYGPSVDASETKKKRVSKNHPLEISSKRQVSRFKTVVEVKKKKLVDPRFDSLSGRLNQDLFKKSYAFLDEYKQNELDELKRKLKFAKATTRREELKNEINLRSQELTENKKQEKIKSALTKRKREEREAVESGKNPFYLKRKDKKKLELQTKFQDLQESGRLSKFMAKKRKKNASKDHRWLPTQRKT
uniref:rRNA biogenesis protein RRP36 n=1 Tax=Globisporangium ultimum (strain ATCC 200006 / CBS 805.95 / DAOM BR144) TaxID=431595 RepID=K3WEB5_GLOUD